MALFELKNDKSSTISEKIFLKDYWQQQALLLEQTMNHLIDCIDGNELAGLACEDEVESRIITGYEQYGLWQCEHGPFSEQTFTTLPQSNWTLLVQGLDQWNENIRDILDQFSFLPRWRLEDIMASYAPKGGGVGPHFDYYDVFLIQISGHRQWQLGQQCTESSQLQDNDQVKLLKDFYTEKTYITNPGDVLYVPAGKAHWGIATSNDCLTFSVGFRAPSEKELLTLTLENIIDSFSDNQRYRDDVLSIDQHPAKINSAVHQHLFKLLESISKEQLQQSINQSFGQLVTEPRYIHNNEERFDCTSHVGLDDITEALEQQSLKIEIPCHTRIAFSESQLFVNGESYCLDEQSSRQIEAGLITSQFDSNKLDVIVKLLNQEDIFWVNGMAGTE